MGGKEDGSAVGETGGYGEEVVLDIHDAEGGAIGAGEDLIDARAGGGGGGGAQLLEKGIGVCAVCGDALKGVGAFVGVGVVELIDESFDFFFVDRLGIEGLGDELDALRVVAAADLHDAAAQQGDQVENGRGPGGWVELEPMAVDESCDDVAGLDGIVGGDPGEQAAKIEKELRLGAGAGGRGGNRIRTFGYRR